MAQVIVIDSNTAKSSAKDTLGKLNSLGFSSPLLIADSSPAGLAEEQFLSTQTASLSACLKQAAENSKEDTFIFINGSIVISEEHLSRMLSQATTFKPNNFKYYAIAAKDDIIDFPESSAENLIALFSSAPSIPFLCISMPRAFLRKQTELTGKTAVEAMAQLFILAVAENEEIIKLIEELDIPLSTEASHSLKLTNAGASLCLRTAIEACNIEDLFPNHAWNSYQEESIAACYHTLAAIFIRLDDLTSASECLLYSDELEDSPRSLALKALIAHRRGETLGAVANMISSLQQYEIRKRNDTTHYLSFAPSDFNQINSRLQAGLEALNNRDNSQALSNFAEAVFDFDHFYRETGVDKLGKLIN